MNILARIALILTGLCLALALTALLIKLSPLSWIFALICVLARLARRTGGYLWGCGSARWCSLWEMQRAGMLAGNGLILGRVDAGRPPFLRSALHLLNPMRASGTACRDFLAALRLAKPETPLVRMPGNNVHTTVFAPTGAGKGVSLVLPWLLSNSESCVVIDYKGENALITANARRKMGHKVVVLDPYDIVRGKNAFNPLDYIDPDSPTGTAAEDIRSLAEAIIVKSGFEHDPHWNSSAEQWLAGIIGFVVCHAPPGKRDLNMVAAILSSPEVTNETIQAMIASPMLGGVLARMGGTMRHPQEKERGSIMSTVVRNLQFLLSTNVAKFLSYSDFDPAELRNRKMTIYIVIPPHRAQINAGLLRLLITSFLRSCVAQGLGEKRPVRFLLDEAAALGKLDAISELVDKYRGYSLRAIFFYQSQGQLNKCFPEDKGQTLLSNCSTVYFGVNDLVTAKEVSERLGQETIALESGGGNDSESYNPPNRNSDASIGHSTSSSYGWSQQGRALLTPSEVMQLDPRIAISFLPGLPPIATRLIRFYEERFEVGFSRRALGAVKVLFASLLALCVSLVLAFAAFSFEQLKPAYKPQQATPKSSQFKTNIFGD